MSKRSNAFASAGIACLIAGNSFAYETNVHEAMTNCLGSEINWKRPT